MSEERKLYKIQQLLPEPDDEGNYDWVESCNAVHEIRKIFVSKVSEEVDEQIKTNKVTLETIHNEWSGGKLLITRNNTRLLRYLLPRYGIYIQNIKSIRSAPPGSNEGNLATVKIRTEDTSRIMDFIHENKEFRAFRVFKHADLPDLTGNGTLAFFANVSANMLGMLRGKTFRIVSSNTAVRQLFYERAMYINDKYKFGCSFDYDEYDYTLEIRVYERTNEPNPWIRYAVVTILTGDGMPNSWTYKEAEE